jgi:hypothetical protein
LGSPSLGLRFGGQRYLNHDQRSLNRDQCSLNHDQRYLSLDQRSLNHDQRSLNHDQRSLRCSFDNEPFGNGTGFTSFDNLLWALLLIFQCVTLEGWTDIMYWVMDATSGFACIYFIILIFIGAFFLLNLALAVRSKPYPLFQAISKLHVMRKLSMSQ